MYKRQVWVLRNGEQESPDEKDAELLAKTLEYTTRIAERIAERALCDVSKNQEAMNNECFHGIVDMTRVWWVQAEALSLIHIYHEQRTVCAGFG